jgi:hypothetical protein
MIARYGLRRLTADERLLFPGLRPVLQIAKVQLTSRQRCCRWPERVGRSASSAELWSGLPKPIQVTIWFGFQAELRYSRHLMKCRGRPLR